MTETANKPIQIDGVAAKEVLPGFEGRFIHSATMTMAYWKISKGASLPDHAHHHEQVVNMLEGEFELTLDGTPHHLKPGDVLVIPGNVPHRGRAITDCRILDVFHPAREDYR
jgi:quercetin dioxygenase-like cupin family protein